MKKLALTFCLLTVLAGSGFSAQDGSTKTDGAARAVKAAPIDCSAVDDGKITAAVKEKLSKTKSLKDSVIEVATEGGIVTLKGTVKTSGLKGVATRMTKRVDCVKKVDNQLKYEQGPVKRTDKAANTTGT